ncbi:MAG: hypothetical protein K8F91_09845 [Candidatus Obscuribacterales bacterium]|nr:hypothetical protein [Candidatus Obscuribacterales bacterium]
MVRKHRRVVFSLDAGILSMKLSCFILAVLLLLIAQQDVVAADSSKSLAVAGEPILKFVFTFMNNAIPWIVGFAADIIILKRFLSWKNTILTALVAFVLSYPSILFALPAFLPFATSDQMQWLAWTLFILVLALAIGCVKTLAYWVINEEFPKKLVAAILFGSAALLTGVAYVVSILK